VATQVTMPVLGLTMEEGTVAEWLKAEGEVVAKDEPLLMVEMDKGTVEVPAPAGGVLRRITVQPGTTVPVKTVIAEIGDVGEPEQAGGSAGGPGDLPAAAEQPSRMPVGTTAAVGAPGGQSSAARPGRLFVTPRARLRARELGIDLGAIRGSGPHGRVVEADVLAVAPTSTSTRTPTDRLGVQPLSRLRRITAERMASSAQAAARVTLFLDADFSEAVRFRHQLEPEFARLGVEKLPWDAIIARAAALALSEHIRVAAQWVDGQGLREADGIHIGVAVSLEPEGLVVPVLRDADRRSLRDLSKQLVDLVNQSRANRLGPAEMQGGVFTITNLGAYRIDGFTPIVNPPETAILGVGRIADKPVVENGTILAKTMCTLSLSFDHRVVDGAPAAAFLARLAELLERPYALLGI
jgi:pyruvate dehydrogenase E2 component (dihydrolipoamide acetyltransferase)